MAVAVKVRVGDAVNVLVGLAVKVFVVVAVGDRVGLLVAVEVGLDEFVRLGVALFVGVRLGVGVGGVPPDSTAPQSALEPWGRAAPRWSATGNSPPGVPEMRSTTGLPASGAIVGVGPPLLCRGPSIGLAPRRSVAAKPPPSVVPNTL